jgi:hypothetical protein
VSCDDHGSRGRQARREGSRDDPALDPQRAPKATKVGTQHVIEEADLLPLIEDEELPIPETWRWMRDGRPTPNVVRAIRLSRAGR